MPTNVQAISSNATFTESDLVAALGSYGGGKGKTLMNDPKMFKATFDLLKSVASGDALSGVSAAASAASTTATYAGSTKATQDFVRSASFTLSTAKASMDLAKIARLTSAGSVFVFVGATTVQKTGLAVSLAGGDSAKTKCIGAIMELAGSVTVTAITAPTGVLAVLAVASLTASAYSAYSCVSAQLL